MIIRFCSYVIILILLIVKNSTAQTQPVKFNLVSGSNGISLGRINGITRDANGVMWFSDQDQQCIFRYDGTMMTKYAYDQKNPNNSHSLGGRYPECIFADSSGMIWIGFWGTGLDRLDPETNTFTHFRHRKDDPASLASDTVSALLVDHLGNLWVGNNDGLDLLNRKTNGFKHFSSSEHDTTSLSDNIVRAIYEDHAGTLWIGTGFPWIEAENKGGLNKLDRETGKFTRYMHDPKNPHSLINNKVRAIFEDSRGIFWVGTGGDGLHSMDRKTGSFERHTYNAAKPEQLSRPPFIKNVGDHITFISEDASGYLWIGTYGNGMIRYDTATKKITHFGGNADKSGVFKDINCWWINASKDGLLWLSTQEPNLYRVDLLINDIPRYETRTGRVYSLFEEKPNVLWLGTENGLVREDIKNGTLHRFLNEPRNPNSLSDNVVTSIIKDKQGDFWLGTRGGGINRFNPVTRIFTRFQYDPKKNESLSSDNSKIVYEDGSADLWIATENGLNLMDRKEGKFTHYQYNQNDTNSISSNTVTTVLREDSNVLWAGTYYFGVNKMNIKTGKWKHYLPNAFITSIYKDADGIIWVGAENGLYQYNKKSDDFSTFGVVETGFSIHNITSIVGDDQDNLWLSSSSGIYRINQKRDQIIIYNEKNGVDGFTAQINWGASAYKGLDGKIYFGSSLGYYAFYPDKIKSTTNPPKMDSVSIWLNGRQVTAASEVSKGLDSTVKKIRLKHDQTVFSIGFTAIDYGDPGDKKFYYKLENYDDDWRPTGVGERAYYNYVPPGKYVFRVKVANIANGVSAEKLIGIIISPPWWQTWWAYSIFALCFFACVILILRVQKKRVIEKERKLSKERELEMQALRAQMNPHFIFNSLSSINHFVLKNETEAASDYLTKFSKLIRTVLNNSKKSMVSLEEELEMLRLYLEMENLRFKNTFTYCIHLDKTVKPTGIFIPPLLFQPFVENAVWHGLMHKKDPGRLDIYLKIDNDILICIIEDNGVGRSFAMSSESKYANKGKSMGIQITRERLTLINGNSGNERSDFVIHDLYDDAGHAAGTKVILRVRYK